MRGVKACQTSPLALHSHTGTIGEQQLKRVKRVNLFVITCANFTCTEQYNVSLTGGSKFIGLSYKKIKGRQYGTGKGPEISECWSPWWNTLYTQCYKCLYFDIFLQLYWQWIEQPGMPWWREWWCSVRRVKQKGRKWRMLHEGIINVTCTCYESWWHHHIQTTSTTQKWVHTNK